MQIPKKQSKQVEWLAIKKIQKGKAFVKEKITKRIKYDEGYLTQKRKQQCRISFLKEGELS